MREIEYMYEFVDNKSVQLYCSEPLVVKTFQISSRVNFITICTYIAKFNL